MREGNGARRSSDTRGKAKAGVRRGRAKGMVKGKAGEDEENEEEEEEEEDDDDDDDDDDDYSEEEEAASAPRSRRTGKRVAAPRSAKRGLVGKGKEASTGASAPRSLFAQLCDSTARVSDIVKEVVAPVRHECARNDDAPLSDAKLRASSGRSLAAEGPALARNANAIAAVQGVLRLVLRSAVRVGGETLIPTSQESALRVWRLARGTANANGGRKRDHDDEDEDDEEEPADAISALLSDDSARAALDSAAEWHGTCPASEENPIPAKLPRLRKAGGDDDDNEDNNGGDDDDDDDYEAGECAWSALGRGAAAATRFRKRYRNFFSKLAAALCDCRLVFRGVEIASESGKGHNKRTIKEGSGAYFLSPIRHGLDTDSFHTTDSHPPFHPSPNNRTELDLNVADALLEVLGRAARSSARSVRLAAAAAALPFASHLAEASVEVRVSRVAFDSRHVTSHCAMLCALHFCTRRRCSSRLLPACARAGPLESGKGGSDGGGAREPRVVVHRGLQAEAELEGEGTEPQVPRARTGHAVARRAHHQCAGERDQGMRARRELGDAQGVPGGGRPPRKDAACCLAQGQAPALSRLGLQRPRAQRAVGCADRDRRALRSGGGHCGL